MPRLIGNKKVELFVDNGIDKYRKCDDISVKEMLNIFFENQGFFVLEEKDHKIKGYLDMADMDIFKKIIDEFDAVNKLTVKEYVKKESLRLRSMIIKSDETVLQVLKKIEKEEQNYFPVVENDILIGRISKRIIQDKIGDLYNL